MNIFLLKEKRNFLKTLKGEIFQCVTTNIKMLLSFHTLINSP